MSLLTKYAQQRRAGKLYEGTVAWCQDYQVVPRPGFYATEGNAILANIPLVCVDDAPGNPEDGSCHFVYAGPKDNPYASEPPSFVPIEAHDAIGKAVTSA